MFRDDATETRFLYELARDYETGEIVRYMKHSEDPVIRARAAEILGDYADVPQYFDQEELVRELIATAMGDEDDRVRAMAVDSLYRHGEESLERLIDKLAEEDLTAERELSETADWVVAETLIEWLDCEHPEFRLVGSTALAEYGDEHVIEELLPLLSDPDPRVRQRAVRTCGILGDDRCVGPLKQRLEDPRGMVRKETAQALANIDTERALEALIPIARANDEELRHTAVEALGGFDSLKPLVVLTKALADRSGVVRRAAAISLIELFADLPSERAEPLRNTIVDQLERVESVDAVPVLIEILDDSRRWRIHRNTIWLLGQLATDEYQEPVFDALIAALGTEDEESANLATDALLELTERFDEELLKKKLLLYIHDEERNPEIGRKRAEYVLDRISPDVESELVATGVDYTYVREPEDYTRKKRR